MAACRGFVPPLRAAALLDDSSARSAILAPCLRTVGIPIILSAVIQLKGQGVSSSGCYEPIYTCFRHSSLPQSAS
jgi:hypothetical protein